MLLLFGVGMAWPCNSAYSPLERAALHMKTPGQSPRETCSALCYKTKTLEVPRGWMWLPQTVKASLCVPLPGKPSCDPTKPAKCMPDAWEPRACASRSPVRNNKSLLIRLKNQNMGFQIPSPLSQPLRWDPLQPLHQNIVSNGAS